MLDFLCLVRAYRWRIPRLGLKGSNNIKEYFFIGSKVGSPYLVSKFVCASWARQIA